MSTPLLPKKIIFLLLLFYLLCVVILAIAPVDPKGKLDHMQIAGIRGDYFFHLLSFMPLLPFLWLGNLFAAKKYRMLFLFCIGFAVAISTESLQLFISYRHFGFQDMMFNCIGVALGSFVFLIRKGK
jgi:VanZ family protein